MPQEMRSKLSQATTTTTNTTIYTGAYGTFTASKIDAVFKNN